MIVSPPSADVSILLTTLCSNASAELELESEQAVPAPKISKKKRKAAELQETVDTARQKLRESHYALF